MSIFSTRLNELLKQNKITMYRLAKDFQCSKATITNWCYALNEPKASDIVKLAIYFDVSTDYLLGLEDYDGTKKIVRVSDSFNNNSGSINFKA